MPLLGMVRRLAVRICGGLRKRMRRFPQILLRLAGNGPSKNSYNVYRPDPRLLSAKSRRQRRMFGNLHEGKKFCRSAFPKSLLPCGRRSKAALRHLAAANDRLTKATGVFGN
jgi:hypothetical protein